MSDRVQMKAIMGVVAAAMALAIVAAENEVISDVETWNQGVEYYRRGDVTNALRVLRPLTASKGYGARAAEVVAKLEYERGDHEEAARLAQVALRESPEDARANRNFTRATDGLLEARETARINAVLKAAQGKDPGALMQAATQDARKLMMESGGFVTNTPERAVALSNSLSSRAEKLADAWIPLREMIAQAVTNEEQAATIIAQIEQAQAKTKKAAAEFGDLNAGAYSTMSDVEHDFTRFFKLSAMPPAAMGEDLVAQSNAWMDVEKFNGREWQQDALDYTRAFRQKFPAWARAYEQQVQSDTNRPPFTAEDQAKISALATELEKVQLECVEKALPAEQEKALEIIRQINELLPKDKNGGGQNQQQQQNQQSDKNQQNQQQDQQQDQQQNESDQKQQNDPNEQQPEQKDEKEQQSEAEQKQDEELEATLKKAQERNDEHEAEKKARMRKAPLPPNERDW